MFPTKTFAMAQRKIFCFKCGPHLLVVRFQVNVLSESFKKIKKLGDTDLYIIQRKPLSVTDEILVISQIQSNIWLK